MLKELIKLANHLDQKGLRKEADQLDGIIKRYAEEKAYKIGTMFTPLAAKKWKNMNPEMLMIAPRGYSNFFNHWKYHFGGESKVTWDEYQKLVKELNPLLLDIEKLVDGEIYSAPVSLESEGSIEYDPISTPRLDKQ